MKINFNTQIEDTTARLLADYLKELKITEPKASKASIADAAILEYIQKRQAAN